MTPRRQFLQTALLGSAALAATPLFAQTAAPNPAPKPAAQPAPAPPPPLDAALVKEFVTVGHHDFPRVKAMLEAQPRLLNATWDWGNGDYETALGAAAHMGRRDIALFLLDHGARADVFALAMLGHLDAVKAMVAARPNTARCEGPHGISLMVHAQKGGAEAAAVVDYLRTLAS